MLAICLLLSQHVLKMQPRNASELLPTCWQPVSFIDASCMPFSEPRGDKEHNRYVIPALLIKFSLMRTSYFIQQ